MDAEALGRVEQRVEMLAAGDVRAAGRLRRVAAGTGSEPDDEWRLLTAHSTIDGTRLDTRNVHVLYLHLTDVLIHRITAGGFDRVVFLDKSARPVCWLVSALWDVLATTFDEELRVVDRPPRPAFTFLNIDRQQWRDRLDPQGVGALSFDLLPGEVPAGLRRALLASPSDRDVDDVGLWSCETLLDGGRVLVVDEVSVSGDTAVMAAEFVQMAVPAAVVEPGHWMRPRMVTGRDGNRRNNLLPVWYRDDTVFGRGVGERDPDASQLSPHWRVRAGAWFLSRPHPPGVGDELAVRLRDEIRRLAGGLVTGEQVLVPDFDRDDAEERCRWFNGLGLRELTEWRERNGVVIAV